VCYLLLDPILFNTCLGRRAAADTRPGMSIRMESFMVVRTKEVRPRCFDDECVG
jgi:hypothetical protein